MAHFWELASTRIIRTFRAFRKVLSLSTCDLSGLMSCSRTTQMSCFRVPCGTALAIAVKQYTCTAHEIFNTSSACKLESYIAAHVRKVLENSFLNRRAVSTCMRALRQ